MSPPYFGLGALCCHRDEHAGFCAIVGDFGTAGCAQSGTINSPSPAPAGPSVDRRGRRFWKTSLRHSRRSAILPRMAMRASVATARRAADVGLRTSSSSTSVSGSRSYPASDRELCLAKVPRTVSARRWQWGDRSGWWDMGAACSAASKGTTMDWRAGPY